MTVRYKLTMIDEIVEHYPRAGGKPYSLKKRPELCGIGYFDSEEELKQWAARNDGQLAKENEG